MFGATIAHLQMSRASPHSAQSSRRKNLSHLRLSPLSALSLVIVLVLLANILLRSPQHLEQPSNPTSFLPALTTFTLIAGLRLPPPPSVHTVPGLPQRGDPVIHTQDFRRSWIHPRTFAALAAPCTGPECTLRLFLYTQGVSMATHGWDLSVAGCKVGVDVYPLRMPRVGVYECVIPRNISIGEQLAVVLNSDYRLHDFELGGRIVEEVEDTVIDQNDFQHLPENTVMHNILNGMPLGKYRLTPSNVTWGGQLDGAALLPEDSDLPTAKYEMCIMTQEKAFPEYIDQWIEYHRRLGVDMIYIYDNHCTEDLAAKYSSRTDVEVIYWPWVKSQVQAQNHFLLLAKRRCEWVILIDIDEYLMIDDFKPRALRPRDHLKSFLRYMRDKGYGYIQFPEIMMGSSGLQFRPQQPMAEAYIHRRTEFFLSAGKFAAAKDCAKEDSKVHNVSLIPGARAWLPRRKHLFLNDSQPYGHGVLVHFKHRSWEDWVKKSKIGRNSIMVKEWKLDYELSNPDPSHMNMSAMVKYTTFREYWRWVMRRKSFDCPTVVAFQGGRRCVGSLERTSSGASCSVPKQGIKLRCSYGGDRVHRMCAEGRRTNYTN